MKFVGFISRQVQRNLAARFPSGGAFTQISHSGARQSVMVHLYLCLPDRCGQKIHKSKKDRRFLFVQFDTACLLYSKVFSVRTGQADRSINAPSRSSLGRLGKGAFSDI